jgi:hypothetical protein
MGWTFYNASGEAMIIDGGLHNVLEDTTPQLGGNLDMQASLLVGNGGSTGIAISANGEVTMAAQPSFGAYNSVSDNNQVGDGNVATVDLDTELWDLNADFASDTFTAPVTGKYIFTAAVRILDLTSAAVSGRSVFVTSNGNWQRYNTIDGTNAVALLFAAIVDMDASDTVTFQIDITGEASDRGDIQGARDNTWMTGMLLA